MTLQLLNRHLARVLDHLHELSKNPSAVTGVSTGFVDLDELTSGMHPGDLIILTGAETCGRTALALNIVQHVALDLGLPVLIFSMDITCTQIASRLLNSISGVDQRKLRTGRLDDHEWDRVNKAIDALNGAPIHADESAAQNILDVCDQTRDMFQHYGGLGLILVDDLQRLSRFPVGEARSEEMTRVAGSLKVLASELKLPILAIARLKEHRELLVRPQPEISDLRDFEEIEPAADVVLLLRRDGANGANGSDYCVTEIIICKQRSGQRGAATLKFNASNVRFENHGLSGVARLKSR